MRQKPCNPDQDHPRKGLSGGNRNVSVIARHRQTHDQLHRCEPEQDRRDPLVPRQTFGQHDGDRKEDGGRGRGDHAGVDTCHVRARHDQNANEPHESRDCPRDSQPLTQDQRAEDNHPNRRCELQCKNLRERDDVDRVKPQVLTSKMRKVACQMRAEAIGFDVAPSPREARQRAHNNNAHHAAEHHDLKRVERVADLAPRHSHAGKRRDRAGHPQSGLEDWVHISFGLKYPSPLPGRWLCRREGRQKTLLADQKRSCLRRWYFRPEEASFPLNRSGWFGRDVIGDPVDAGHFVDDPRGGFAQEFVAERIIICGHPIHGGDGAQRAGIVIGAPVAHHPHGLDRKDRDKGLPNLVVKPMLADLIDIDRIGLAQDVELGARNLAGTADREAGTGEGVSADKAGGQAQFAPQGADLVLEQLAQRLDQLHVHPLGQAAHIVVRFDRDRGPAAERH
mmetsp:Transcript_5355/g.8426  ORF Transcript_5355/g.8426 Transcript_5355/m.8426 type:complete len:450 (-) Transcript_5355:1154-2503(-)